MPWSPAEFPGTPPGPARTVEVPRALVTSFDRGPLNALATAGGPRDWMTGAVHDQDGVLVTESQRVWAGDLLVPVAADPEVVRVPPGAGAELAGTWRYAGHWRIHFGHFLLEALTNLWGEPAPVDGLLFHRSFGGRPAGTRRTGLAAAELTTWQRDLLDLAGYRDVPVRLVRHRPVRVEHLRVASRPLLLKSWAGPEAVDTWRRVSAAVGTRGAHRKVFLSRSRFHRADADGARADPAWDEHLDVAFAQHGFEVVHPETLSIAEQVAAVRGASCLAGSSGSALHLSAFAEGGTRVLEVGDARSPQHSLPAQRMVDAACGHLTQHVAYGDRPGLLAALAETAR